MMPYLITKTSLKLLMVSNTVIWQILRTYPNVIFVAFFVYFLLFFYCYKAKT